MGWSLSGGLLERSSPPPNAELDPGSLDQEYVDFRLPPLLAPKLLLGTVHWKDADDATGDSEAPPRSGDLSMVSASGKPWEQFAKTPEGLWSTFTQNLQGKMAERSKACDSSEGVQKPIVCLIFRVSHQGNPGVGSNPTLVSLFTRGSKATLPRESF